MYSHLLRFYLFLERGEGRERNINVWLSLAHPLLGIWTPTQACALTGNRTSDPLVCRPALNPLCHTSQGLQSSFKTTTLETVCKPHSHHLSTQSCHQRHFPNCKSPEKEQAVLQEDTRNIWANPKKSPKMGRRT